MLAICPISDGAGDSEKHLQHSDYFDELNRVQGHWFGLGAAMPGLVGSVISAAQAPKAILKK